MAFVDDYSPINFVDLPNETTPIDAENLNKMDSQIKKLSTFASTTDPETTEDRLSGLEEKTNSLKEDLSNKITKFYASNQGETHLADSDNGKIQDMVVYGKSEQSTTTGKNIFNPSVGGFISNTDGSITSGSISSIGATDFIKINGKDITVIARNFSSTMKDAYAYRIGFYDSEKKWIKNIIPADGNKYSINTFKVPDAEYIRVSAPSSVYNTLQIEYGSEATSYEPYTGGIPSPNPDYPQEIKSVVNPTVKLLGSNILKIRDGEYQDVGCTITVSNGVIKLNGTSTDNKCIYLPIDTPSMLKEGTEIIFCPNNIGGTEHLNKCYVDYSNENTKSLSITSNTINTPYVITRQDARYEFKLSIKITRGNNFNNETWKPQILIGKQITPFEPYKEQSIQLPITLNAIPVSSGGNYTDQSGQQWICDEVDLERGVLVQRTRTMVFSDSSGFKVEQTINGIRFVYSVENLKKTDTQTADANAFCSALVLGNPGGTWRTPDIFTIINMTLFVRFKNITSLDELRQYLQQTPMSLTAILVTPIETPLTSVEIADFNAFITYYPVTNISVNSEQLDGYTVFNYPISMANGWNYVKQQIGDTRDYIYDMDTQSAEAYVNSEYAVALTELEV